MSRMKARERSALTRAHGFFGFRSVKSSFYFAPESLLILFGLQSQKDDQASVGP